MSVQEEAFVGIDVAEGRVGNGRPAAAATKGFIGTRYAEDRPRERLDPCVEVGLDLELHRECAGPVAGELLDDLELDDAAIALKTGKTEPCVDECPIGTDEAALHGGSGRGEVTVVGPDRIECH